MTICTGQVHALQTTKTVCLVPHFRRLDASEHSGTAYRNHASMRARVCIRALSPPRLHPATMMSSQTRSTLQAPVTSPPQLMQCSAAPVSHCTQVQASNGHERLGRGDQRLAARELCQSRAGLLAVLCLGRASGPRRRPRHGTVAGPCQA